MTHRTKHTYQLPWIKAIYILIMYIGNAKPLKSYIANELYVVSTDHGQLSIVTIPFCDMTELETNSIQRQNKVMENEDLC